MEKLKTKGIEICPTSKKALLDCLGLFREDAIELAIESASLCWNLACKLYDEQEGKRQNKIERIPNCLTPSSKSSFNLYLNGIEDALELYVAQVSASLAWNCAVTCYEEANGDEE